jgi:hypothetical protein
MACHTTQSAPLYDQAIESIQHLLVEYSFTRQIWHETIAWLRLPCSAPTTTTTTSLLDWWQEAKQNVPRQMLKGLTSLRFLVEEKNLHKPFQTQAIFNAQVTCNN